MVYGMLFGSQRVVQGQTVQEPWLQPTEYGYWDYDFTEPVEDDLVIDWIEY